MAYRPSLATRLVLLWLLVFSAPLAVPAGLQRCFGEICIGANAPTYDEVRTICGAETSKPGMGFSQSRSVCTYDATDNVSVVFSFTGDDPLPSSPLNSIFVAKGVLCMRPTSRSSCRISETEDGLRIGQLKDRVLKLLGSPSRIDDAVARERRDRRYERTRYSSRYGKTRLHFERHDGSLLFNQFGIGDKGTISSIWLNDSE